MTQQSIRALTGLLVVSFLVGLVTTAPPSILFSKDRLEAWNLTYDSLSGSLWQGTINQVKVSNRHLGDISYALSSFAVTELAPVVSWRAENGTLSGEGELKVQVGSKAVSLLDTSIFIDLADLGVRLPITGQLTVSQFNADLFGGICRSGQGQGTLSGAVMMPNASSIALSGDAVCQDGMFLVSMDGRYDDVPVRLELNINQTGVATSRITMEPMTPLQQQALTAMGFSNTGSSFEFHQESKLN